MITKGLVFLSFSLSGLFIGSYGYIFFVYLLTKVDLISKNTGNGLGYGIVITAPICLLICLGLAFLYKEIILDLNSGNFLELRFLWGYPLLVTWLIGPLIIYLLRE